MTLLFIFMIIGTIVIDFFTYKKDIESIYITEFKRKRTVNNFISCCLTYLLISIVFVIFYKCFLMNDNTITNTLVGVIVILFQYINIYNFFDNYIYAYRFLCCYCKIFDKIFVALVGLVTVLFNEVILSFLDLSNITFVNSSFNVLIRVIIYAPYIFLTILLIIREFDMILKRKNKDDIY